MDIELERTFLVKYIPKGLKECRFIEITDVYVPESAKHPILRIRKKGEKFEMTKKQPIELSDSSRQTEHTVILSEEEYADLSKIKGKRLRKKRYLYPFGKNIAEIDIFLDDMKGLVLVDFEFRSIEEKDNFIIPDFCLAEVTEEKTTAGGVIAGKKYSDLETFLKKYGYEKIILS